MKKPKQQIIEKQARVLSRTEQVVVTGGGKVMQDGAISDDEYAAWGVAIKDPSMR